MAILFTKATYRLCLASGLFALAAGCSATKSIINLPTVDPGKAATVENRFDSLDEEGPELAAAGIELRDNRPEEYTVVKGDTLWDITGRFLTSPWLWPQVWNANPSIKNPHLIYPGDLITLGYDADGNPLLMVSRNGEQVGGYTSGGAGSGVEKRSPRIRAESLQDAIPTIPGEAIQQFLVYPRVVTEEQLSNAPYVIGNYDGRLTSAVGHQIYARGSIKRDQPSYGVFRRSKPLTDPISNELLGYEVSHVANARLMQLGDPSTLLITSNKMETISGDRLMNTNTHQVSHQYVPRMPRINGEGRIVSLVNAISQAGRNQIVVLNLGERSGIQIGDVLAVERRGGTIRDRFSNKVNDYVEIPNTRTGVVMVFQTFDKVSYALIMESTRPIHKDDVVTEI